MPNDLTEATPYFVRVFTGGGRFAQSTFATMREAISYAQGRRRAGWLRKEIDVGDMWDGSRNVAL